MARIVHLTTAHHPFDPRIFRKQLRTLAEAGFDAHLVVPHERSSMHDGVYLTALPPARGRLQRALRHPALYHAARRLDAALYHFHDPELIPVAWLLKRTTGARVVYDMHENYRWHGAVEGGLVRVLERWCFAWVDHVVVANAAHRRIPAASGVPTTTIANYHKPLAESGFEEPAPLENFRAIYTGVMADERGLPALVDLAALLQRRRPRWQLDLVGVCYRDADRQRAEERLHRSRAAEAVHSLGWDTYVPWPVIARASRRAHVGLLLWDDRPHNRERVPTKFYEYLSAGLPVVCSDLPRWRALVEQHRCGAVVPPGDAQAAFAVLDDWATHPACYGALAANARAAARHYQWPVMGRRLVRLYNRLLER